MKRISISVVFTFAALSAMGFCTMSLSGAQTPPPTTIPGQPGTKKADLIPISPEVLKAKNQWDTAIALQKSGKVEETVAAYREYIRLAEASKQPVSKIIPAYQNLAVLYRGIKRTKELTAALQTIISLDSKYIPAYAELASIYRMSGKAKELAATLQKIAAIEPKNAQAHVELAYLYTTPALKNYEESRKEARKTIALKPNAATLSAAYATLGLVSMAKSELAAAEIEFQAAARENPKNPLAYYYLALVLTDRKKYPQALASIKKSAELDPKSVQTKVYTAVILERLGRNPEALQALLEVRKVNPGDPATLFNIAQLQQRMGDTSEAISSYISFLLRVPGNYAGNMNLGELYSQIRNLTAARQYFGAAHRIDPKDPRSVQLLAQTEMDEGLSAGVQKTREILLKQAEDHFKEFAVLEPKSAVEPGGLARYYERVGQFVRAQDIYRKRLLSDPSDLNANIQIGRLFMMQRKLDEAIAAWTKYRDLKPDEPQIYNQIANAYENQAKWSDAVATWKLLLERKPKGGVASAAMIAIGKDLIADKKPKEARTQLEEILKLDATAKAVPEKQRLNEAASIQAARLEGMRMISGLSRDEDALDDAIRMLQQVKTEEAVLSEKNHQKPNPQTYRDIAKLYEQAKKPELAIKELETLTTVLPEDASVYETIAQTYENQGKQDEAVRAYRRAAVFSKDPLTIRTRIAESYQRAGKLKEAVREYEAMQRDFPKDNRYLNQMAMTYRQAGQDENALRTYDALLAVDPRALWALDQKAVILTHLKRFSEAKAIYEKQLLKIPENRQMYADVAYVFSEEKRPDEFLTWVTPRFEKTPANSTLMAVVLDEYVRQKQEEKGWDYLKSVIEKHKSERPVLDTAVSLMNQRNRKEDALAIQRRIAALSPKDLNAQTNLADQLATAGHSEEAFKLYKELIARTEITPAQRLLMKRQFARTAAQTGNKDVEIAQLKLIVQEVPDDYDAATTLALRYIADKREADAIPLYLKLATSEVYNPRVRAQIRVKLGELYEKIGQKENAVAQYKEALKLNVNDVAATTALKRMGEKI